MDTKNRKNNRSTTKQPSSESKQMTEALKGNGLDSNQRAQITDPFIQISHCALLVAHPEVMEEVKRMPGVQLYEVHPSNTNQLFRKKKNAPKVDLHSKIQRLLPTDKKLTDITEDDRKFLSELHHFISLNIEKIALVTGQLEKVMGMSHSHFHRKLKVLTGLSGKMLIKKIRIQRACELLKKTELRVADICYSVGFSDPRYFSKVFKKEVGMSPTAFKYT